MKEAQTIGWGNHSRWERQSRPPHFVKKKAAITFGCLSGIRANRPITIIGLT
ncbi:hypothetical protein CHCC20335_0642 [Bacillus paralicheniformis]|nr:hypothetical protein CHCC20335_0642 [Bacillus paralicheniformis]